MLNEGADPWQQALPARELLWRRLRLLLPGRYGHHHPDHLSRQWVKLPQSSIAREQRARMHHQST
jgi:hypothetical protein